MCNCPDELVDSSVTSQITDHEVIQKKRAAELAETTPFHTPIISIAAPHLAVLEPTDADEPSRGTALWANQMQFNCEQLDSSGSYLFLTFESAS